MKLSARDANRYFGKPDPDRTGVLIYGPEPCASRSNGRNSSRL